MDNIRKTKIVVGILILQLLRYDNFKLTVIKNNTRVNSCSETVTNKSVSV